MLSLHPDKQKELENIWNRLQAALKIHCGMPEIGKMELDDMCLAALESKVEEFEKDNRKEE